LDATSFTVGFSGVPLMALIPAVSHYLVAMSALGRPHVIYIPDSDQASTIRRVLRRIALWHPR